MIEEMYDMALENKFDFDSALRLVYGTKYLC